MIAIDVTPRPERAPLGTSPAQLQRIIDRAARTKPEVLLADFVIHAELNFEASPWPRFFRYARQAGEDRAKAQLPTLLALLSQRGLAPKR